MRQTRTRFYLTTLLIILTITGFEHCKQESILPKADPDKGAILPEKFEALVVVDSTGNARHFAYAISKS